MSRCTFAFASLLLLVALITCLEAAPAPALEVQSDDVSAPDTSASLLYDVEEEPCRVGSIEYKHREKVPRVNPCELCLCLHSALYCWWQDQPGCPQRIPSSSTPGGSAVSHSAVSPAAEGDSNSLTQTAEAASTAPAAPDTPPCIHIESCESGALKTTATSPSNTLNPAEGSNSNISSTPSSTQSVSELKTTSQSPEYGNLLDNNNITPSSISMVAGDKTTTSVSATTQPRPQTCSFMGTEYQVGQVLPHETGTCLECVCGDGARVSCSPKDCGGGSGPSGRGDMGTGAGTGPGDLDLGPSLDMFDVDTF